MTFFPGGYRFGRALARFVAICTLLLLVGGAFSVSAAVVRSGDTVSVPEGSTVEGDFYAVGNDVHITGTVTGDVYVLAGTVTITGAVTGDIVVLGGTVSVHGAVGDDVRILGGKAVVAGDVAGDVVVLAGSLSILSTAHIAGDVLVYGGQAEIAGAVAGAVHARVDSLVVNAPVGAIDASVAGQLSLGNEAHVAGDIAYDSAFELSRSQDSQVGGATARREQTGTAADWIQSHLTFWFMALFSALVSVLLFKDYLQRLFTTYTVRGGLCGFLGLGVLLIAPVAVGLLCVSVIGMLVGVFLLCVYLALLLASLIVTQVFIGAYIAKLFVKEYRVNWRFAIVGVVATQMALLVPFMGPLLVLAACAMVSGMIVYHAYLVHNTR